jgi:hypothetical protein
MPTQEEHHDLTIDLDGPHAKPRACPLMKVGDTVTYLSDQGEVKVQFVDKDSGKEASPFESGEATIIGSGTQKLKNEGTFEVRCFVKPQGKEEFIGWDKDTSPESGGQFPVKPNDKAF